MKKIYLIMQRHVVSVRRNRVVWSEWYLNSSNAFRSLQECEDVVSRLRSSCVEKGLDCYDYRSKLVYLK